MRTITVRIESDHDAELLKKLLQSTKFEDKVEAFEEYEDFSDEELKMFEERLEEYERNPSTGISLEDFKKQMKDKHGL